MKTEAAAAASYLQFDTNLKRKAWVALVAAGLLACGLPAAPEKQASATSASRLSMEQNLPTALVWETVANNATLIPDAGTKTFSSYNQPSVNGNGFVVFRARSTGSEEGGEERETMGLSVAAPSASSGPVRGIFTRDMKTRLSPGLITQIARNGSGAPQPNNLDASFNEFPSIPRIDLMTQTIATRAQSTPVWEYWITPETTTRVGTSGVYANPAGPLQTVVNLLGAVPDAGFSHFEVPGTVPGTRFDQFPGAPGVAGPMVVFKGNWTDVTVPLAPEGRTGVYYRDLTNAANRTQRIADNVTSLIPGTTMKFGSTAPPSAAKGFMVFAGSDNEDEPTAGGIYRAPLLPSPSLQTLVKIGGAVPDAKGRATTQTFKRFGEGLSFDGRYVAFWGAWGTSMRTLRLQCAGDGNKDVIAYCVANSPGTAPPPDGEGDAPGSGYYPQDVPVEQGIFVHDTLKGKTYRAAQTGLTFKDFLFWNYSGRPPGTGGGDGETSLEPPRWRSNAFAAINGPGDSRFRVAFKAQRTDGSTGIYMVAGPNVKTGEFTVVVDTSTSAWAVDPSAPADTTGLPLLVTSMGLERDSFRSDGREDGWSYLVINSSMANIDATVTWAGIYLARVRNGEGDEDEDEDD